MVDRLQKEVLELQFKSNVLTTKHISNQIDHFVCPITGQLMVDPVVAIDGYTYERAAVEWYFTAHGIVSPTTGLRLPSSMLTPNKTLARVFTSLSVDTKKQYNETQGYASLPEELLFAIFQYLDPVALARLCQVCHSFNRFIRTNHSLWQRVAEWMLDSALYTRHAATFANQNREWTPISKGMRTWREILIAYAQEEQRQRRARRAAPSLLHQQGGVSLLKR
eukprot:TRINITY_DN8551_c0_g1_i1.p2 TRINITY_DN8551_c0_g1~~TRINITY_DN8551_c0_g1_i1.p2  ORF type:complete len:222 (+),score=39.30 TRINITY_DN8551_c0_g1_i1:1255-1920(+)